MRVVSTGCINFDFWPTLLSRSLTEPPATQFRTNHLLMFLPCIPLSSLTIEMALFLPFFLLVKLSRHRRVAVEKTSSSMVRRFTFSALYWCSCLLVLLLCFSCVLIATDILDSRLPVEMVFSFTSLLLVSADCNVKEPLVLTVLTANKWHLIRNLSLFLSMRLGYFRFQHLQSWIRLGP